MDIETLKQDVNYHRSELNSTNARLDELRQRLKARVSNNLEYRRLNNQRAMLESRLVPLESKLAEQMQMAAEESEETGGD